MGVIAIRLLGVAFLASGGQGLLGTLSGSGLSPWAGANLFAYAAPACVALAGLVMLLSARRLAAWLVKDVADRATAIVLVGVASIGFWTGTVAAADTLWGLGELLRPHETFPSPGAPLDETFDLDDLPTDGFPIEGIPGEGIPGEGIPGEGFPGGGFVIDETPTVQTSSGEIRSLARGAPDLLATHEFFGDRRPLMWLNLGNSALRSLIGLLLVLGRAPIARRLA